MACNMWPSWPDTDPIELKPAGPERVCRRFPFRYFWGGPESALVERGPIRPRWEWLVGRGMRLGGPPRLEIAS